jgi:hypothetical protein
MKPGAGAAVWAQKKPPEANVPPLGANVSPVGIASMTLI